MKPQEFNEIKTQRLILKPFVATFDFANKLFEIISGNREFFKYMPWADVKQAEQEFDFLRGAEKAWKNKTKSDYAMYLSSNNEFVGCCSFFNINWDDNTGEIGYWLNPKYAKQGLMSEAVSAITQEYMAKGFERIIIHANPDNIASCKTAEKCQYKREGIMRNFTFNPSLGKREDIVLYAKIKEK